MSKKKKIFTIKGYMEGKAIGSFTEADLDLTGKVPPPYVTGAPDIAHPSDRGAYEHQLSFITDWFFKMWERTESADKKAANKARVELQTLLLESVGHLERLARAKKKSEAKRWAGELAAIIGVSVKKHDKILCKANPQYAEMKKKLSPKGLTAALFPKGNVGRIVHRELKKAEYYRNKLLFLKSAFTKRFVKLRERMQKAYANLPEKDRPLLLQEGSKDLKEAANRHRIPKVYLQFMTLHDFSQTSEPEWRERLSPLIKKCLPKDTWYERQPQHGSRKRYPSSDDTKGIRDCLELLAKLRDANIY